MTRMQAALVKVARVAVAASPKMASMLRPPSTAMAMPALPRSLCAGMRVLAIVVACVASGVAAAASTEVSLEAMTSPELAARVAAGATTILVPIGGTEQSGPYVALGKHNVRAVLLATRIAQALGNAIVAPVIAYVPEGNITPPTEHMHFAGTITVPEAAFQATLTSAAESFRAHGFRDIVFLGDHGGYQSGVARVSAALNRKWASTPARAHALPEYYRAATVDYEKILAAHGITAAESGTHAGVADTALMLALAPSSVRASALRDTPPPTRAQGVYGDPRRATAELGQLGVDHIVATSVAAIRAVTVRH